MAYLISLIDNFINIFRNCSWLARKNKTIVHISILKIRNVHNTEFRVPCGSAGKNFGLLFKKGRRVTSGKNGCSQKYQSVCKSLPLLPLRFENLSTRCISTNAEKNVCVAWYIFLTYHKFQFQFLHFLIKNVFVIVKSNLKTEIAFLLIKTYIFIL